MTLAFGWIGGANMGGFANHSHVTLNPASPADLAHLLFFQPDLFNTLDNAGVLTPMAFTAEHTPASGFDYPPNVDRPRYFPPVFFGPEIYGGVAVREHLGADIICVKLAPSGSFLTVAPGGLQTNYTESWFNASSHQAWDPTLPHSTVPYDLTVLTSGVATATGPITLTDAGASWVPGEWSGRWVVRGGRTGLIVTNTATDLLITFWGPPGAPPAPGAYEIQRRTPTQASLAKSFLNYCSGADAVDTTFDMRAVGIALGDADARQLERAMATKQNTLSLMWYIRNELVARSLTTKPARQIGICLALLQELPNWPYASLVNRAFREIAASDPFVRLIQVADLPVGGVANNPATDPTNYNGPGQQSFGKRFGAGMIALLSQTDTGRSSHEYFGRHHVMRPVWGIGNAPGGA